MIAKRRFFQRGGNGPVDIRKADAALFTGRDMINVIIQRFAVQQHHQRIGTVIDRDHVDVILQ
ncbi:hypothetical protein D3C78_1510150 [compost metagenome]